MDIALAIKALNTAVWGWPFIAFVCVIAIIVTTALRGVQFRYFLTMWKLALWPEQKSNDVGLNDMTPLQAFFNALSTSIGNGSIAGMATAVYAGGPGVAFWVFVGGLLTMSVRFAEVYLANSFTPQVGQALGGPLLYLARVPGGSVLPYLYAAFGLFLSFASGNAMQAQSIRIGIVRITGVAPLVVAIVLGLFIAYVIFGGARRIVKVSDQIVPIKVGVFFISAIVILAYHAASIVPALRVIVLSALTPSALFGAAAGFSVQQAIRFGLERSVNATEAGLGIAALMFGATGSKEPVKNGIMSMLGTFISANLVCFSIILMIVASGVWSNGQTSIDLTISAYETVFGSFGGWLVSFLSISFGLGVIVAYAYIARACWLFLTGGRWVMLFNALYGIVTFVGTLASVDVVWDITGLVNAGLLVFNLFGIVWLLPAIQEGLRRYTAR